MVLCEMTRRWCGVKKIQEEHEATKQCKQGHQERSEKWLVECKQLPPLQEIMELWGKGAALLCLAIKGEEDRRGHGVIWVTVAIDYIALIDFSF